MRPTTLSFFKISLVVSLLVMLLSGCSLFYQSQNASQSATSALEELQQQLLAQDTPQVTEPELVHFKMLNDLSGWGLTQSAVLRTLDGGRSWFVLNPDAQLRLENPGQSSYFLDTDYAWVLAGSGAQNAARLHHTSDSGLTWQVYSPPFETAQLFFVDAQHGWALVITGIAAGSTGAQIYRTQDAGQNWELVHQATADSQAGDGQLPFSGLKNGLSFRDTQHGYLAGSVPAEGYVYLYQTADGGLTWQQSSIDLPPILQTSFLSFEAPVFFSPEQGKLVVRFQGPQDQGLLVFTTNNGGERWIATNPISAAGQADFASMQSGRVWDGETIFVTNDGGVYWVKRPTDLRPLGSELTYQFVNVNIGFVLVVEPGSSHRFYLSEDGGADWVRLP